MLTESQKLRSNYRIVLVVHDKIHLGKKTHSTNAKNVANKYYYYLFGIKND